MKEKGKNGIFAQRTSNRGGRASWPPRFCAIALLILVGNGEDGVDYYGRYVDRTDNLFRLQSSVKQGLLLPGPDGLLRQVPSRSSS